MAFPFPPNVTVDIYRTFNKNDPLGVTKHKPDVPQVQGVIRHHMEAGRFGFNQTIFWTNLLYLPVDTDVRSAFNSFLNPVPNTQADTVVIDDYPIAGVTTAFYVVMVQLASRGADAFLKVYLDKAGKTVLRSCCEDQDLPNQLRVTITDFNLCPCLNGQTFPITLNTQTGRWEGNFSACNHTDNFFWLQCVQPQEGIFGFAMGIQCSTFAEVDISVLTSVSRCDPFHLQFTLANPTVLGDCCSIDFNTYFDVTT